MREFLYYTAGSAMVAGWFVVMFFFATIIFEVMGF